MSIKDIKKRLNKRQKSRQQARNKRQSTRQKERSSRTATRQENRTKRAELRAATKQAKIAARERSGYYTPEGQAARLGGIADIVESSAKVVDEVSGIILASQGIPELPQIGGVADIAGGGVGSANDGPERRSGGRAQRGKDRVASSIAGVAGGAAGAIASGAAGGGGGGVGYAPENALSIPDDAQGTVSKGGERRADGLSTGAKVALGGAALLTVWGLSRRRRKVA